MGAFTRERRSLPVLFLRWACRPIRDLLSPLIRQSGNVFGRWEPDVVFMTCLRT